MGVGVFAGALDKGFDGVLDAVLAGVLAGAFDVVLAGVFVRLFAETSAGVLASVLSPELGAATEPNFGLGIVGVDAAPHFLEGVAVDVSLVFGVDFVVVGFFLGPVGGSEGILTEVVGRSLSSSSEYISSSTIKPSWPPPLISTSAS